MIKLYFIVNPNAGNGKAKNIWLDIEKILQDQKIQYQIFFTEYPGHAALLSKEIVGYLDGIIKNLIVVGGDGTVNEVISGIGDNTSFIRIGLIPGGSGNDFSRGYGIPSIPKDALFSILKLAEKRELPSFDIGEIKHNEGYKHFFINSLGAGFDALISYEANGSKWKGMLNKLYLGQFIYVISLLKNVFSYKRTTVDLTIDGIKYRFPHTWFVTVSNQPYYGGGMKIAPNAIPNDKKLNITIVHHLSRLKLLLVFLSVFWGKHLKFKEVKTFLAETVSIQSSEPIFVHSDGEHIGFTPIDVCIKKEPICILTRKFES